MENGQEIAIQKRKLKGLVGQSQILTMNLQHAKQTYASPVNLADHWSIVALSV